MERIYDASALLNLVLSRGSRSLAVLTGQAVLDLTAYEIGNAIWKMSCLQKKIVEDEACVLLDACMKTICNMSTLSMVGLEKDVKEMAVRTRQSFYDSAYMVLAKKHGLELVTDDAKLQKSASGSKIRTSSSDRHRYRK